jgi:hypothetical protein
VNIYLAGPMRGYWSFNFPRFHKEAELLRSMGHTVFNPAEEDEENGFDPDGLTGDEDLSSLGFNLKDALSCDISFIIHDADAVVVLPRWRASKGARAEAAVAVAIGIPVLYVSYDENGIPSLEEVPDALLR